MIRIQNKKKLRATIITLAFLVIGGYVVLTYLSLNKSHNVAADASLEQAARAYGLAYQMIKYNKASPKNDDEPLSDNDLIAAAINDLDSGVSYFLGSNTKLNQYDVFLFSFEKYNPKVSRLIFSGKQDKTKEWESVYKAEVEKHLVQHYQEDKKLSTIMTLDFKDAEIEEIGFLNYWFFNQEKRFKTIPLTERDRDTGEFVAITRTAKLIKSSSEPYTQMIIKSGLLVLIFTIFTALALWIIYRNLSRLLISDQKLENKRWIEEKWWDFGHEIGTPLLVIKDSTSKIQDLSANKEITQEAREIEKAYDDIETILQKQKVLHRDGEERSGIRVSETITANTLLSEALNQMESRRKAAKIKPFVRNFENKDAQIRVDKDLAKRAIRNLVANAINATSDGGIIELSVTSEEKWLVFKILDTGKGLSKDFEKSLSDNNMEYDNPSEHGRGLRIVQQIMTAHCGEFIKPRNREDRLGVEVILKFPLDITQT
jgi:signal transduction histidine kinase